MRYPAARKVFEETGFKVPVKYNLSIRFSLKMDEYLRTRSRRNEGSDYLLQEAVNQ
jgi:hypothetical protein